MDGVSLRAGWQDGAAEAAAAAAQHLDRAPETVPALRG